jgi:hypothetical protein
MRAVVDWACPAVETSPEAREVLRREGIVVIDYEAIQQAWQGLLLG